MKTCFCDFGMFDLGFDWSPFNKGSFGGAFLCGETGYCKTFLVGDAVPFVVSYCNGLLSSFCEELGETMCLGLFVG